MKLRYFWYPASLLAIAAGIGAGAMHGSAPSQHTTTVSSAAHMSGPSSDVRHGSKVDVILTFDDGPDPVRTPIVLNWLKQHDARAVFFEIGKNVQAHPEITREVVADGNVVGDHTYSHPWLAKIPLSEASKNIEGGADVIEEAGAPRPYLFRPPYGSTDKAVNSAAASQGMKVVLDNGTSEFESGDYGARNLAQMERDTKIRVHNGSVITMHDTDAPIAYLNWLDGWLKSQGLGYTTLIQGDRSHTDAPGGSE